MERTDLPQAPRVLIVCFGAIGDVTRALPLLARIKRHRPQARITWAVEPISQSILTGHPYIDRLVVFERPRGLPAYLEFLRELRGESYDLVLDLQRHFKSGVTSLLSGARRRIGFHRQNSRELNWLLNSEAIPPAPHMSYKWRQFQSFGDHLNLPELDPLDFGLQAAAGELEAMRAKLESAAGGQGVTPAGQRRQVGLILGSTWESRFWLAERYRELIGRLWQDRGCQSVLIGGRREREFADEILGGVPPGAVIDMVEKTTLRELVPLFSLVRAAIGSDSGPMHIAAAVGTPVISLWGSTSPRRSAPYGSESLTLEVGVPCGPCYKKICPGMGMICMKGITADMVLEKFTAIIEGRHDGSGRHSAVARTARAERTSAGGRLG